MVFPNDGKGIRAVRRGRVGAPYVMKGTRFMIQIQSGTLDIPGNRTWDRAWFHLCGLMQTRIRCCDARRVPPRTCSPDSVSSRQLCPRSLPPTWSEGLWLVCRSWLRYSLLCCPGFVAVSSTRKSGGECRAPAQMTTWTQRTCARCTFDFCLTCQHNTLDRTT